MPWNGSWSWAKTAQGSKTLRLGMGHRPDVGGPRESPSVKLLKLLAAQAGAGIGYHDPHAPYPSKSAFQNSRRM